jgi:hypothetical protein
MYRRHPSDPSWQYVLSGKKGNLSISKLNPRGTLPGSLLQAAKAERLLEKHDHRHGHYEAYYELKRLGENRQGLCSE